MSCITYLLLENEEGNLASKLKDRGAIHSGRLYSIKSKRCQSFETLIDFDVLDHSEWEKIAKEAIDAGIIDALTGERTDLPQEYIDCMHLFPVFLNGEKVSTYSNYDVNTCSDIIDFVSAALPDDILHVYEETEGSIDCDIDIKGGTVIKRRK